MRFTLKNENLKSALAIADDICRNLNKDMCYRFKLAYEELVVNLFEHAVNLNATYVNIDVEARNKDNIYFKLEYDGGEFDPTKHKTDTVDLPLEKRKEGGLGLFLVFNFSKRLAYSRKDGINMLEVEI